MIQNLGVVGTGLVGASVGMRGRAAGASVVGCDTNRDALARALARGAIDEEASRDEVYGGCDTIVIALPPEAACAELRRLSGTPARWRLLIDVASVKRVIMKAAQGVARFVGTHPLAGAEASGPECADATLFEGRTWCYVPSGDAELDARVAGLITMLGAAPLSVTAEEHDATLAVTSHLPQMVAWLLAAKIRSKGVESERFCGPAGLEVLRLARSSPALWNEILQANADNVGAAARALAAELTAWRGVDEGNRP
ncbi:MAG: prephenate dehydrogenase [Candidatus Tyrphobacter sp.]